MYRMLINDVANETRTWLIESSLEQIIDMIALVPIYPEMLDELRTIEGLLDAK